MTAADVPMDPAFLRLVDEVEQACSFGDYDAADGTRLALWRWHREEVAKAEAAAVAPLHKAIQTACGIIEVGDQRLLAGDGPAGGQPPQITLKEWRTMYKTLKGAIRA